MLFWVILLIGFSPVSRTAPAQDSKLASASVPVWQVDLRAFGYTGYKVRSFEWAGPKQVSPIFFSDPNVLVASFVTRGTISRLQRRNQAHIEQPFILNIISLDASSGKPQSRLSWPQADPRSRVVPMDNGDFIVVTPERMALYSPNSECLAELRLHTLDPSGSYWDIHLSPSRKSILIEYSASDPLPHHFAWIDTESLRQTTSWRGTSDLAATSETISDDHIAVYKESFPHPMRTQVKVLGLNGSSRVLCDMEFGCGIPAILNSDTLVLLLGHDEVKVIKTDGQQLFDDKFPYDTQSVLPPLIPSANGQRFAVPIYRPKGGWPALDISPRMMLDKIVVYDIGLCQAVYTLDEKKSKMTYSTLDGIALSSDGSELAVLADGVLKAYRIPAADAGSKDK